MYLDTSVAAKLFIPEPDSDECEAVVGGLGFISSELLLGELWSAILGKERAGHISPASRDRIWATFQSLLRSGGIQLVPLNGGIVAASTEVMTQVHPDIPLRALDAIHLATFMSVDAGPLFTRDKRMAAAARRLGLTLAE